MLHPHSKLEWGNVPVLHFHNEQAQLGEIRSHILEQKYNVVLDFTHWHLLNREYKDENLPIINYILDEECPYEPPNTIVGNQWQKNRYKSSRIIQTGIDINKYTFIKDKQNYLSFCGKIEYRKGYDIAYLIGKKSNNTVRFAGPDNDGRALDLDNWIGEIREHKEFCDFVGNSKCLLYPSRSDAGGIAIWEAMALGTPTITTNRCGAQFHVKDRVTGYVVATIAEAVEAVNNLELLKTDLIRETCAEEWDLNKNFRNFYTQIQNFVDGERW
jgi:glycosyltransferase involved in cell wall biosynthesis